MHLPRCDKRLQRGRRRPAADRAVLREAVHRRPDGGQRNHGEHVRVPAAVRSSFSSPSPSPSSIGARGCPDAATDRSTVGRQYADVAVIAAQPQCAADQAGAEHAVLKLLPPQQSAYIGEQVRMLVVYPGQRTPCHRSCPHGSPCVNKPVLIVGGPSRHKMRILRSCCLPRNGRFSAILQPLPPPHIRTPHGSLL